MIGSTRGTKVACQKVGIGADTVQGGDMLERSREEAEVLFIRVVPSD